MSSSQKRYSSTATAGFSTSTIQGQDHDRIRQRDANDTSLSQKMLSAVTGSVLTSLLVTPLDVVRVRLQSQINTKVPSTSIKAQTTPSTANTISNFVKMPPNLGVSACCREVFWVPNQSQFCVASGFPASAIDTTSYKSTLTSSPSICAAEETQRRTYTSTLDGLRKIARNEGIFTLWRGLSPTLLMAIPGNVIYFAGYDWLRQNHYSPIRDRVPDYLAPLIAGSSARVLAACVVSPVEMLRTRMQACSTTSRSTVMKETIGGIRDMVKVKGYTALWKGLTLTFWRDVPFSALYWWGYEVGRQSLHDLRVGSSNKTIGMTLERGQQNKELDHKTVLIDSFIAGAISGAIASVVTTPFDVGKTRQQVARYSTECEPHASVKSVLKPEDRSMPRFLWHIFQTEGVAGLFKGWTARCLKVAPACAIMISSYEIGKKMAAHRNENRTDE